MRAFDAAYVEEVMKRLEGLPADRKPNWGTMTPAQMIGHLNVTVRYMAGNGPEMPFKGNMKTRYVFKPLILNGIVAFPHNIKLPTPKGMTAPPPPTDGTPEELRNSMNEFIEKRDRGELSPRTHPFFGPLNSREWSKFQVGHFKHHFLQFSIADGL